jgi:D-threo-aldose 1-dehydrogenase
MGRLGCLSGRYTLLEQAPIEDLLPQSLRSGISIVIGAPFNTGILAGRDTYDYKPASTEILDRVNAIKAVCDRYRVPLIAAALQFPLAHPAVAAILPGPRNIEEFETNVRLLNYPIPSTLWEDLRDAELIHSGAPTPA